MTAPQYAALKVQRRKIRGGALYSKKIPAAKIRSLLLGGAACGVLTAIAAGAQAQPAGDQSVKLPEIVVTAQRREQSLQSVPVSVTAITQQTLAANRIQNISDLNALAPNLTVHTAPGGAANPAITLRGVQTFGTAPGSDREVSLYLDGVYIGNTLGSIFDVADLSRIEVLKGPQGTLFGRNATAGAISLITREPSGRLAFHEELTGGDYDQFRSKTRIDLPSWGPLSASATYLHWQRRGDIRNLGAGTVWTWPTRVLVSPQWLGDHDVNAVTAAVKFKPNQIFSLIYRLDWSEDNATPAGNNVLAYNPAFLGPAGPLVNAILLSQPNPGALSQISLTRPSAVNNWFTTPSYLRNYGHNLTGEVKVNSHLSFKNILAYRGAYTTATFQLDGSGGLVLPPHLPLGPAGSPFLLIGNGTSGTSTQWSDEFQINFDTRWVTGVAGYLHYQATDDRGTIGGAVNSQVIKAFPGFIIPNLNAGPLIIHQKSDAVYSQLEAHLTSQFDLVGGIRYTRDHKSGASNIPGLTSSFTYGDARPSYMVSLNYKPVKDTLLYVKYSTAYMSGGSSYGVNYNPEIAESWEGGVKSDFLERRLRADLAVYWVKYKSLQAPVSGTSVGLPQVGNLQVNFGDGEAKGFEFEGTALPVKGLTLQAGVGYTDFKYLTVNPVFGTVSTFLPVYRPKWTANLSGQYDTPPIFGKAYFSFRIDGNYRSGQRVSPYLVPTNQGPVLAGQIAGASFSPSAWVVNARASLMHIPVAAGEAAVALWVKNLADDRSFDYAGSYRFVYSTSYQEARTFGVDMTFDY
jgi:iron complex outermembrane receptor protein